MCLCVCTSVPACVPVLFRLPPPELNSIELWNRWILQLDHILERDTESDNGAEFFTVEAAP